MHRLVEHSLHERRLDQLRAQGYLVLDEDIARLSPFAREHLNVVGNYTFSLPDLGEAGFQPLRDPTPRTTTCPTEHAPARAL
jgi:hypothetical protein